MPDYSMQAGSSRKRSRAAERHESPERRLYWLIRESAAIFPSLNDPSFGGLGLGCQPM